jgi:hypothetical protein
MNSFDGKLGSFEAFNEWSTLGQGGVMMPDYAPQSSSSSVMSWTQPAAAPAPGSGVLAPDVSREEFDSWQTLEKPAQAESSGSSISAGEVMTGIGAILAPLLQVGVGIYSTHQQMEMQKDMLKRQQMNQRAGRAGRAGASYPQLPRVQKKSPALLIVGGLVVIAMVGGMMYMMSQKGAAPAAYAPAAYAPAAYAPAPAYAPLVTPPTAPAPPPQIRKVRRVRKRKKRPSSRKK